MMIRNIIQYALKAAPSRKIFVRRFSVARAHYCTPTSDVIYHQPGQDDLLNSIRHSKDTLEVLDLVGDHSLSSEQTITCLRSIFNHQKQSNTIMKSSDVIKHPVFENLCNDLRRHCRNLTLNDTIDALKILSFLKISPNSRIMTSLLSLIKYQINDVTLAHLIFLDFLLRKMQKTPLTEALSIALPMIFQIQLPLKLDPENIREVNDCLAFVTRNAVSEQCKTNIVTTLTLHGEDLTALEAAFTIKQMCELKPYNSNYDKLISNCFAVLNKNFHDLYFSTIDSILTKVVDRYNYHDQIFYDEEFMRKSAEFVIKNDKEIETSFYILKKFNKLGFVNYELLNYLLGKLMMNPKYIETVTAGYVFTLVGALSIAHYAPVEWLTIKDHVLQNPVFENERVDMPWLKFVLDLLVLDVWKPDLIERIFAPEFLRQYFARDNNDLDYSLLLILYQVVTTIKKDEYQGPLPDMKYIRKAEELNQTDDQLLGPSLKYIYSNFSILSKARTRLGHNIEYVIVLDKENHPAEPTGTEPAVIDEAAEGHTVEDLQEQGYKLLGVIRPPKSHYVHNFEKLKGIFWLKLQTLEHILPVTVISGRAWKDLLEKEKIPYLEQVIRQRLENQ
uniref:CSON009559 protein n=1 Tax=Culicoides sonorensis TaxID=179676 RepID=A0A336MCK0_CULSO